MENNIKKFEAFISNCQTLINNCKGDVFEKSNSRGFNLEAWQKKSFLYNKRFVTGSKIWREKELEITNLQYSCKTDLKHYLFGLNVSDKHKIYNSIHSNITESINNIQNFIDNYNLTHCDIFPNVHFIFEMRQLNIDLKQWIEKELKEYSENPNTGTQQNKIPPPQIETEPTNSFDLLKTQKQKDNIESVFNSLKKNSVNIVFISDRVKLTEFKKIFNNTPLNKISPIDWQKSIASLRYFIKQFPFEMSNKKWFKITACCFTHNSNKLNYSQIENAKQVSEKDKKAIDNIFKH